MNKKSSLVKNEFVSFLGVAADLNLNFCSPFTPLQAFSSLKEILRSHKSQATVVEGDFSKLRLFFSWIDRLGYAKAIIQSSTSNPSGQDKNSSSMVLLTTEQFWAEIEGKKGQPKEMQQVLQKLLVRIISQILKMDESEGLDIHQNLQEMGLDSLMMVELKNLLQGVLGPHITLTASVLSEANTIHKLVKKLHEMIMYSGEEALSEEEKLDLILSEAVLAAEVSTVGIFTGGNSSKTDVEILLSGSVSSQLTLSVIENLSKRENVRKIIIMVVESEKDSLLSRIDESKIDMIKCQLISVDEDSNDHLGIARDDFERLALNVDGIVDVSLKLSSGIETTGLIRKEAQKTKSLLEFATYKKVKFVCHITRLLPQKRAKEVTVLDETLPSISKAELQRYSDRGYLSSQYVSECLLRQAVEQGVPCQVFRVPHLSGDSLTGRFEITEGHIFVRYMEFLRVGKIPTVPLPFAVVPVNQAADLILHVFLNITQGQVGGVDPVVFTLSNPHEYSYKDFFTVSQELGKPMRAVELDEFLADKNSLIETVTFSFGDPMDFTNENSAYSKLADASSQQAISCANFRKVMADFDEQVETPLAILRRDLKYAQDSGLFQQYLIGEIENASSST